jgi:hypothetical protein
MQMRSGGQCAGKILLRHDDADTIGREVCLRRRMMQKKRGRCGAAAMSGKEYYHVVGAAGEDMRQMRSGGERERIAESVARILLRRGMQILNRPRAQQEDYFVGAMMQKIRD